MRLARVDADEGNAALASPAQPAESCDPFRSRRAQQGRSVPTRQRSPVACSRRGELPPIGIDDADVQRFHRRTLPANCFMAASFVRAFENQKVRRSAGPREAATNYTMTRSQPECDGGGERHGGEGVGGELVLASGDAAEVLEAAEGVRDKVATAIALLIVADRALVVAATGDERSGAYLTGQAAQPVDLVPRVPR